MRDPRGERLRALDVKLSEFTSESGGGLGGAAAEGLCELGAAVAESARHWMLIARRSDLEPPARVDARLTGLLAIEAVFDRWLDGPAFSLLVAAFELEIQG